MKSLRQMMPSNLVVFSQYGLPFRVLNFLEMTVACVGGEILFTDALDELLKLEDLIAVKNDAEIYNYGNKQGFFLEGLFICWHERS